MVIVHLIYIKGIVNKIASNNTILYTRVYNVWRLHIKNRLGFLLACRHRDFLMLFDNLTKKQWTISRYKFFYLSLKLYLLNNTLVISYSK